MLDSAGQLAGCADFRLHSARVFESLRIVRASSSATLPDIVKLNYQALDNAANYQSGAVTR